MRVLLVEDDAATAASIERMLRKESFVCDTASLGEDGLEIGKLYDYDIIILDLLLPDIDGYEVLRRLRAARVRTPILIVSGLAELDHKIRGLGYGADEPELEIDGERWTAGPCMYAHSGEVEGEIQRLSDGIWAGIASGVRDPAAARSFIDFMRTHEAQRLIRAKGLAPA